VRAFLRSRNPSAGRSPDGDDVMPRFWLLDGLLPTRAADATTHFRESTHKW
jgi:hypothetical protein